jgi:predicted permease
VRGIEYARNDRRPEVNGLIVGIVVGVVVAFVSWVFIIRRLGRGNRRFKWSLIAGAFVAAVFLTQGLTELIRGDAEFTLLQIAASGLALLFFVWSLVKSNDDGRQLP